MPETRAQNVLIEEIIELTGEQTKKKYTRPLRRIAVWNDEHGYVVQLLTNNFKLAASTIAETRAQNVLIDEIIELTGEQTKKKYTRPLRRIAVWNDEHGYVVQLLTNNFKRAASTIAQLYKARWMIEIFFRNIKQLLKIKSFIGTSRNAVETQIWTALSTMLLLCWLKHIAKYKWGLAKQIWTALSTMLLLCWLKHIAKYKWGLANLVVSLRLNTFTKIELEKWLKYGLLCQRCYYSAG